VLRDHAITEGPLSVDLSAKKLVDTPIAWAATIKTPQIEILSLVTDEKNASTHGWCTYTYEHSTAPELEFLCGGINSKTPQAGGIWRQGHLLHFGFEQSPDELNSNGQALLLNSICYIARFTEDRPIVRTPSVFYSSMRILDRKAITRLFERNEEDIDLYLGFYSSETLLEQFKALERDEMAKWYESVRPFIHADGKGKLIIDRDAQELNLPPADPQFFATAIPLLAGDAARSKRVRNLLMRYAPDGPSADDAGIDQWNDWWKEREDCLFFSDTGGYRWYIDSLAKKRGVPSRELRGPARASTGPQAVVPPVGGQSPAVSTLPQFRVPEVNEAGPDEPTSAKPVVTRLTCDPSTVRPGDEMNLIVEVSMASGHHIHAAREDGTGIPTEIKLEFPEEVQSLEGWEFPAGSAVSEVDASQGMAYRDQVRFTRRIRLKESVGVDEVSLTGHLFYQVCDAEICSPRLKLPLKATIRVARDTKELLPAQPGF